MFSKRIPAATKRPTNGCVYCIPLRLPKVVKQQLSAFYLVAIFSALTSVAEGQSLRPEDSQQAESTSEAVEFFEAKIRPVLITHCAECHSSDTEASGGLLLDARSQIIRGGDSGPAVDFENSAASLLLEAIGYTNPDLQMPPEEKLPEQVVKDFRKWIEIGLPDPRRVVAPAPEPQSGLPVERAEEHWAYRSRATEFTHDSIDGFLYERLENEELNVAPRASAIDLLRRLTFDLNGLPPTEEQITAFNEASADGYSATVDSLLASPAFGETFARHWMDVVRYAESITLRGFVLPNAWRYRNYLIDAYNDDRPFDQLIREQIAGDLFASSLADDEPDSTLRRQQHMIATGFWALGNTNLEQQDKTQLEMDYIDEQLEVMGRAFLAQTIGCARCHDHKFDPIPTRDYYALAGILRSTVAMDHDNVSKWLDRPLPMDEAEEDRFERLSAKAKKLQREIAKLKKGIEESNPDQQKKVPVNALPGYVIDDSQAKLVGTWTPSDHTPRMVGTGYRYHDINSDQRKTATFEADELPAGEYEVRLAYSAGANRASNVRVDVFSGNGEKTLTINQRKTPPENKLWVSLGTFRFEKDGQAFVMLFSDGADGHVIADAVQFLPIDNASSGGSADEANTATQKDEKTAAAMAAELKTLEAELQRVTSLIENRPNYLAIVQRDEPKDIPIHIRGDVHNLADVVPRGVLTAIGRRPTIAPDSAGRLELANWLADRENPLSARVYTNRVWSWLMGQGLAPSVNNFGTTGFEPTHPELLDWLTDQFIQSGWSTKHLVSLIVASDAYQRKVLEPDAKHTTSDPRNQLYWSGHARRLSAEALRDAMLVVSGELESAPASSLIRAGTKADYNYKHASNSRSVYQPVFRNSLPDLFEAFDFADPSASVGQRPRSTVATQSLVLANHPWIIKRAQATAERLMKSHGEASKEALITTLFSLCYSRQPSSQEMQIANACLDDGPRQQQLARLAHALFASLDFRYLR